jgi:hypothetical protein
VRKTETERERERENELQGGGTRSLVGGGGKKTQESIDREYRRFAGDHLPLRGPALSYSAKGAGPVSGAKGLVVCACVAIYTHINHKNASNLRTAQTP